MTAHDRAVAALAGAERAYVHALEYDSVLDAILDDPEKVAALLAVLLDPELVAVRKWTGGVLPDGTTNHPPIDYDAPPVTHHHRGAVMTTDDRGAAALAERLADAMAEDDHWPMFSVTRDIKPLAAAILGERGRFLPDGPTLAFVIEPDGMVTVAEAELARLRRIEAAARAYLTAGERRHPPEPHDTHSDGACSRCDAAEYGTEAALRAALTEESS